MATDSQNRVVAGVGLPSDVVDDILAARRRRAILRCLVDTESGLAMDSLVRCVLDQEGTTPDEQARSAARANIYEEHLPKLTATGIVTYDSMRERVELTTPGIVEYMPE